MIIDKLNKKNIILASGSPRRQELFKGLNLDFKIDIREIEEIYPKNYQREEITNYLAHLKAKAFEGAIKSNDLIITSDTIVWFNGKALEKPKSFQDAVSMLSELSGNFHEVITSVCLKTNNSEKVFHDITKVYFKELTQDEILFYVENYKPYDKAGAYGIQEWIGFIGVSKLEGSYFNVMGLPVHKVYEELLKL